MKLEKLWCEVDYLVWEQVSNALGKCIDTNMYIKAWHDVIGDETKEVIDLIKGNLDEIN